MIDPYVQQAKLTASDGAANDYFGFSVAISGGTVLVGAYGDTIGANTYQGSAYVYEKPGTGWATKASNPKTGSLTAFSPGGTIKYTVVLTNSGGQALSDTAGDEFTDQITALLLPSAGGMTATTGTITYNVGTPPTAGMAQFRREAASHSPSQYAFLQESWALSASATRAAPRMAREEWCKPPTRRL